MVVIAARMRKLLTIMNTVVADSTRQRRYGSPRLAPYRPGQRSTDCLVLLRLDADDASRETATVGRDHKIGSLRHSCAAR